MSWRRIIALIGLVTWGAAAGHGQEVGETPTYRRIRAALDAIPAIDTHDHLWPFDRLPGLMETRNGQFGRLRRIGSKAAPKAPVGIRSRPALRGDTLSRGRSAIGEEGAPR